MSRSLPSFSSTSTSTVRPDAEKVKIRAASSASIVRHARLALAANVTRCGTGSTTRPAKRSSARNSSYWPSFAFISSHPPSVPPARNGSRCLLRSSNSVRRRTRAAAAPLDTGNFGTSLQLVEAPRASRADAPDRDVEGCGDVLVARRRVGHQDADQCPAALGERLDHLPEGGRPLRRDQQRGGLRVGAHRIEIDVAVGDEASGVTDHAQALMACGCGEPRADSLGIADPPEVLDETQPGRLAHIGSVRRREPVAARNRPDEPGEPVDECIPRFLVAVGSRKHELCEPGGRRRVMFGSAHRGGNSRARRLSYYHSVDEADREATASALEARAAWLQSDASPFGIHDVPDAPGTGYLYAKRELLVSAPDLP